MVEFIDETEEKDGTPLNRKNMLAIQGFEALVTVFNDDGSITQTNSEGHQKTTTFSNDGRIIEVFIGEKTITKTTTFKDDGSIEEEIS